jgi:TRAP-type C4-dicarboxylate transport system substrate-binding protein
MSRRALAFLFGLLALGAAFVPAAGKSAGTAAQYELRFGTLAPDDTPWSEVLMDFKKSIEKDSGGRVAVKVWLNGSMGDEKAMLQKMKFGQLSGGGFSTGGISSVVPELQILELPFLFRSDAEADYVMDEVLYKDLQDALAKKDLVLFIWAVNGWLDFGSARAIRKPEDLKASKVFMQESGVQLAMYESLGVQATPLPVPEVLGALQTGLIDTYSSSPIFATAAQWFAHTKHWADSDHSYQPAAVVFSKKFWDSLPADVQQMVHGYKAPLTKQVREAVRGLDPELFQGFRENGVDVFSWTKGERDAFRHAAWPSHRVMVERGAFPRDWLDRTYEALDGFRARQPGGGR